MSFGDEIELLTPGKVGAPLTVGELTDAGADGGQNALDHHIRQAEAGQTADHRQHHCQHQQGKQYPF